MFCRFLLGGGRRALGARKKKNINKCLHYSFLYSIFALSLNTLFIMENITTFCREVLVPALSNTFLPSVFPKYEFVLKGRVWYSQHYLNGDLSHKKDKTFVYVGGSTITENGGQTLGLIDFYMTLNACDFANAIKEIAKICNIELPNGNYLSNKQFERFKTQQALYKQALQTAQNTLLEVQGKQTLEYLHSRGYNDELIKKMQLGALSLLSIKQLQDAGVDVPTSYCNDFPLLIPYITEHNKILGFKFRCITTNTNTGKYRNTRNLNDKININPFLLRQSNNEDTLYIVEGELDALHLFALGKTNVCAVSGVKNGLPLETAQAIKNYGWKQVIFVPDNDEAGYRFVIQSLKTLKQQRIKSFVSPLPKDFKDVDEYLTVHEGELDALPCYLAYEWYCTYYTLKYKELHGSNLASSDMLLNKYINDILMISNESFDTLERYVIQKSLSDSVQIPLDVLVKHANEYKRLLDDSKRLVEIKDFANNLLEEVQKDNNCACRQIFKSFQKEYAQSDPNVKFGTFDCVDSPMTIRNLYDDSAVSLDTEYWMTDYCNGRVVASPLQLTIPYGGITVIAAPTSHGKSTFLRNLALDSAVSTSEEGTVIYMTLEESKREVLAQMINTYLFKDKYFKGYSYSMIKNIKQYLSGKDITSALGGASEIFKERIEEFLQRYLYSGKLRCYDEMVSNTNLIEILEHIMETTKVKAVFLDYIQIVNYQSDKGTPRYDMIKQMCIQLKDLAIKHNIAVVLASQLNRDVKTPFRMDNTYIAECADIERAANTIICLWNSSFKSAVYGLKSIPKEEEEEIERLASRGFSMGTPGKILAKITKQRSDRGVGMYGIYDFLGYAGRII